jgi:hypothetical protein
MKLIHYGTSGEVQINDNKYRFEDLLKLEPHYSAPHGFGTRVYEREVKHYITDGHNLLYLPSTDAVCDRICNREWELDRLVARLESEWV